MADELFGKKTMNMTSKHLIATRAWEFYLENKTEENHKRFVKICKRLYK